MPFVALLFILRDMDTSLASPQRATWETPTTAFPAVPHHLHTICGTAALSRISLLSDEHQRPALRITLFSQTTLPSIPSLLDALTSPPTLTIGTHRYLVEEALLSPSPWTGLSDWTDFLAPPYGQTIRLHFGTPLLLLKAPTPGYLFPLPCPLFASVAHCWQQLGGPPLPIPPPHLEPHLSDGSIVLADYCLSGRQVLLDGDSHLGLCGSLSYQCHTSLETVRLMLTALSRFAFFAGVGFGTERGMGTTRVTIVSAKEQLCSGVW
jgi:CRISPR-associated endoribonuclease Cas6